MEPRATGRAVAFALLLTVGTMPLVATGASHGTFEGAILLGNPTTAVTRGVSEAAADCQPGSPANGVDGVWHRVDEFAGGTFTLTMESTLDADLYFYTLDCTSINDKRDGAEALMGFAETGDVPPDAGYAIVNGFVGSGSYTLKFQAAGG